MLPSDRFPVDHKHIKHKTPKLPSASNFYSSYSHISDGDLPVRQRSSTN